MTKITKKQIEEWQRQVGKGNVVKLATEDGKEAYLKDPLTDLRIMKMAIEALSKSVSAYVESIVNACWLGGDEEIKTDEQYLTGLEDQVNEFTEISDFYIENAEDGYATIKTMGYQVKLKRPDRNAVKFAEQKNPRDVPFETSIHLAENIVTEGLDQIKQDTKAYISLLTAIREVRQKKAVMSTRL
jgi:hypothetical protein